MSHRIRINEDTASLCDSCKYGKMIRAKGTNRTFIMCTALSQYMDNGTKFVSPMEKCDFYADVNHVDLYDMKKIAWLVDNTKKNSIGFIRPEDQKRDQYENIPDEMKHIEDKLPQKLRDL